MVTRAWLRIAVAAIAASTAATAGCDSFEDPNVVIDLRILAMAASPPTQVLDVDLTQTPSPAALLAQLQPTTVCALVADPPERRLVWSLSICGGSGGDRCGDDARVLARGIAEDPETAQPQPAMCATVEPDADLLALLLQALQDDGLRGLGGLFYAVQLRVGGEGDDPALDQFASKGVRTDPRIPASATANTNPRLDRLDTSIDDVPGAPLLFGRCVDTPAPFEVPAGTRVRLTPAEPTGVREDYVIPTLDGRSQMFTESLTYQWITSDGGLSSGNTGGPRDISGNPAPLFTDFSAPGPGDLDGPTDITLWIIQRDERLGSTWYEACIRVVP